MPPSQSDLLDDSSPREGQLVVTLEVGFVHQAIPRPGAGDLLEFLTDAPAALRRQIQIPG